MKKYKSSKSLLTPNTRSSLRKIYINLPHYKVKAHPVIQDALIPQPIIYFEPIRHDMSQISLKQLENTSGNKRQKKVYNKISQFYSFLHERDHITKVNNFNMTKTKGLYEKKRLLKKENSNGNDNGKGNHTVNDKKNKKEIIIKNNDDNNTSNNLIAELSTKYKARNMKLPNINSRDKHNLFKLNPLLQTNTDLYKYFLLHKEDSVVNNANRYLENIQKNVNKKLQPKQTNYLKRMSFYQIPSPSQQLIDDYKTIRNRNVNLGKTIQIQKREISTLSKTIDNLQAMDDFYNTMNIPKHNNKDMSLQSEKPLKEILKDRAKAKEKDKEKNKAKLNKLIFKNTSVNKKSKTPMSMTNKGVEFKSKINKIIHKIANQTSRNMPHNNQSKSALDRLYFDCVNESKDTLSSNISSINAYMKTNQRNMHYDNSNQGLIDQMNQLERAISLRNCVKETYNIQSVNGNKMDLQPNQQELLNRSMSLDKSIKNSHSMLIKVLHNGLMPD